MGGFVIVIVAVAHTTFRADLPWLSYYAQAATCGGFGVFAIGAWVSASDFGGSLRAWFTHRVMLFDLNYALGCIDAERYVRLARMQANAANEDPEEIRALQLN